MALSHTACRNGRRWLLWTALCLWQLSGCVLSGEQDSLLSGFPAPGDNFQQHIVDVRQHLLATRMSSRSEADVEWNLPFELGANPDVSYKGRYLLIHGLNDSAGIWYSLARSLAQRGYDVRAILLPGHGNTPEALLTVRYQQWLQAARLHFQHWYDDSVPFYIGGFSLGSVIATVLALEQDGIDGLFLISPAYHSSRNHLLRWASLVAPFKPWVFGGMIIEDNPVRYNSIPINATAQYYKTTRYLLKRWRSTIDIPVLMVVSAEDSVVDIDKTRRAFQRRFGSDRKHLLLFDAGEEQARQYETRVHSAYPDRRILNQSHQSLHVAPSHPLFGENGTVLVCNGNEWAVFSRCLYYQGDDRWYAAEKTPAPDDKPVARITYNPDYDLLLSYHAKVLESDNSDSQVD